MHNSYSFRHQLLTSLLAILILGTASMAFAGKTVLRNICRVKGQEENTLRGLGLVVGLQGTGDSDDSLPTMRALARAMELMHLPVTGPDMSDADVLAKFKGTKNVALVWVTAIVPATGGRRGDVLNCTVSAIRAKSLKNGELVFAALHGPNVKDPTIYSLASGRIQLDDPEHFTHGKIHNGCRLEEDVMTVFTKGDTITLVLEKNHAGFNVATEVAETINTRYGYKEGEGNAGNDEVATAINPGNILVQIPKSYRDVSVQFVSEILDLQVFRVSNEARVVINERAGSIVIGGDVELGAAVVTHKNITVETQSATQSGFVALDPHQDVSSKLKGLVAALERVKVPPRDIIEIIKGLERNGSLHAKLIIE